MAKKLGKIETAVMECADNSDDNNKSHCYDLRNQNEINYWYNKAQERIHRENKQKENY